EGGAPVFIVLRSVRRVALKLARRLYRYAAARELAVSRIRRFDAKRDDMRALVAGDHRFDVAEYRRIDQADDFEIAVADHRAMIAGAERHDRRARRGRTAMDAARRELEAEAFVRLASALEILDGDADVIELD